MKPGDRLRLKGDPGRVGVYTGKDQLRKGRTYVQVSFPDRMDYVPSDQLEPVPDGGEPAVDLLRRGRLARPVDLYRTLTHIRLSGRLANYIYSLETTDTDFYPYQFKPVLKLLQSVSSGILIADEVGLGKTIEAGLIWTELRARFDAQRLLVVCPAMLREKWRLELARRFNVKAEVLSAAELLQVLREVESGGTTEFAAVASLQGVRPPAGWNGTTPAGPAAELAQFLDRRAHEEPLVDLLVMDEAHYLRNPETRAAELGMLLRRVAQYAVLLSATPVHLHQDDLFHLLRIVDEDVYYRREIFDDVLRANEGLVRAREGILAGTLAPASLVDALDEALRHPLLRGNRQIEGIRDDVKQMAEIQHPKVRVDLASRLESANLLGYAVNRTRRREVKEWRAVREAKAPRIEMHSLERQFYDTVTDTVRQFATQAGQSEGFLLVMPQRQMASCMAAAYWYWTQDDPDLKEELLEDLGIDLPEAEPVSLGPLITELCGKVKALGNLAELARHDTKYAELSRQLKALHEERPAEKVVIFSSFRHTLRYLGQRLRQDGFDAALLLGGDDDKEATLAQFADPHGPSILLSSEVGSEGIDLQFAWVLVNYDLPWNPMRVEQRIGRLDRLGQVSPRVVIWNLLHADTIDDRIYWRLFVRLGIFERALGGLEVILGDLIGELTRDLFRRSLTPAEESALIDTTTVALENQRQHEEKLEAEAAALVAYGDYILQQVQAARELTRRIKAEDVQRYVLDFLSQNFPGCRFRQDPADPVVVDVELSADAKAEFAEHLRTRRNRQPSLLARTDPGPVRCRFENRLRASKARNEEVISQFHPLVRFVGQVAEDRQLVQFPAVAVRLSAERAAGLVRPGDYRLAVARWNFEALRPEERLWFGVEPVASGELPLSDEEAERLVMLAAEHGEDWPTASADIDIEEVAEAVEQGLLVEARERFEKYTAQVRAQNDDRADAQLRSLERHLQAQRARHADLIARHRARGYAGLVKAEEANIRRLEAKVEQQSVVIESRRRLSSSLDEVCVGILRVTDENSREYNE